MGREGNASWRDHFFLIELKAWSVLWSVGMGTGHPVNINILSQEPHINTPALGSIYLTAAVSLERYFTVCHPYYMVKLYIQFVRIFLKSFLKSFPDPGHRYSTFCPLLFSLSYTTSRSSLNWKQLLFLKTPPQPTPATRCSIQHI